MTLRATCCCLLLFAVVSPLVAQEKPQPADGGKPVDQTKLLLGDLYRLGDPEINKMMPDLYWALKATEGEPSAASKSSRRPVAKVPGVMTMLRNPSIRNDIEMLDEQYEDLQERRAKIVREMNQQIVGLLSAEVVDPYELREEISKIRARAEEATQKALLPFQFERLKQLQYQTLMQRVGTVNVLTNAPLATELGITDDQKETLRDAAKDIDKELTRKITELRSQAMKDLSSRLKQDQQTKLRKILGDESQYHQTPIATRDPTDVKGK